MMRYLFILLLIVLPGCASVPKAEKSAKQILTIALHDYPVFSSPALAKRAMDLSIARLLFEGLFREDAEQHYEYALASAMTLSPDECTYTFTLRPELAWSDGSPLTAEDVVHAWEHARQLSPHPELFKNMTFFAEEQKVYVHLATPNPDLPLLLSCPTFFVFRPEDPLIFSGPFCVQETTATTMCCSKNLHYYDYEKVCLEKIELLFIPDIYTAAYLMQRERLNWVGQPWHEGIPQELRKHPFYTVYPVEGTFWLVLNPNDPKLASWEQRHQLYSLINRQEIIDYALSGDAHLPQETIFLDPSDDSKHLGTLSLIYPLNVLRCQRVAEILREQCKQKGVTLILEGMEYHLFTERRDRQAFTIATATGVAHYPRMPFLPNSSCLQQLEIIPLYHMVYTYLTSKPLQGVIYTASGSVDLKYASVS